MLSEFFVMSQRFYECCKSFLRHHEEVWKEKKYVSFSLLKENQRKVLSTEICEIFKNTYFEEYLWTTTSAWSLGLGTLRVKSVLKNEMALLNIVKNKTKMLSFSTSRRMFRITASALQVIFFGVINLAKVIWHKSKKYNWYKRNKRQKQKECMANRRACH